MLEVRIIRHGDVYQHNLGLVEYRRDSDEPRRDRLRLPYQHHTLSPRQKPDVGLEILVTGTVMGVRLQQ